MNREDSIRDFFVRRLPHNAVAFLGEAVARRDDAIPASPSSRERFDIERGSAPRDCRILEAGPKGGRPSAGP